MHEPMWHIPDAGIQRLFSNIDRPNEFIAQKGSIITFSYIGQQKKYQIHDPTPLTLVAGFRNDLIMSINLHYLTLPYVRHLVTNYANNKNFSYGNIKTDRYIVSAFRSYKRSGISQLRILDVGFLKNLLAVVRSLEPGEIEQMREQVHQMILQGERQPAAVPGPEVR